MNWGVNIVIGLGACMLFIMGAGAYMVCKNTDTLEDTDYYEKSLSYDAVYALKKKLLQDHAEPSIRVMADTLCIEFTQADNAGQLNFKRPSDNRQDLTIPFATAEYIYRLPLATFVRGSWQLEISWKSGETSYLSDHHLYF